MVFPASSQLPDEIIKEILSPALYVPDYAFSSTCEYSNPFANYELSTSTILVVCKSWLRVATPMLYETVVLRSKAQAQALAFALKENEPLGRFIRKLRVEGGYGACLHEVLRRSPSLTDLWLSTGLFSNESISGYLKGFHLVNPGRLVVVDRNSKTSGIRRKIYEALAEAVRHSWTSLVRFYSIFLQSLNNDPELDFLRGSCVCLRSRQDCTSPQCLFADFPARTSLLTRGLIPLIQYDEAYSHALSNSDPIHHNFHEASI